MKTITKNSNANRSMLLNPAPVKSVELNYLILIIFSGLSALLFLIIWYILS